MFTGYDYDSNYINTSKVSPKNKGKKVSIPDSGDRVNTGSNLKQNRQVTYTSSHHTQNI